MELTGAVLALRLTRQTVPQQHTQVEKLGKHRTRDKHLRDTVGLTYDYRVAGRVINGKVVSVHKGYVTVDNGAYTGQWDLDYDWLVLAPGSSYADGPIKTFCTSAEERQAVIQVRRPDSCQWPV
jgi:ribosomal protein L35AE/L33A